MEAFSGVAEVLTLESSSSKASTEKHDEGKKGNEELATLRKDLETTRENLETRPPSFHNILFMDIVGFSRQSWYGLVEVDEINYLTETVRTLLGGLGLDFKEVPMLPTGDGMALFFENLEHPIKLAIELTKILDRYNETVETDMKIELRIGIHAGDSFPVKDLHGRGNRCGPAINTARRVLDLGQPRQVLCSYEYGERLKRLFGPKYSPFLHDCGTYKVKHGEEIHICNICDGAFGNSSCPPVSKSEL